MDKDKYSSNNVKGPNYKNNVKGPNYSTSSSGQRAGSTRPQTNINSSKKRPTKRRSKKSNGQKIKKGCLNFFLFFLIIGVVLAFVGFGIIAKIISDAPPLDLISIEPNVYTSIVYDKDGNEIDRFHGSENREYVPLNEISPYIQKAIVSVEDQRFYDHFGIDIKGIIRAGTSTIINKLTGKSSLQGASTITQQLIKNNITKVTRNTIETKIQEQYLAVMYERELMDKLYDKKKTKDYILELYLNTIALGHGYNGVEAASLGYYNKSAKDLTLAESASIAAITNNPTLYSPRTNPENNRERVIKILDHMIEQGMITQAQYDEALAEDIYSKVSDTSAAKPSGGNVIHGYFEDALFEQVSEDLQVTHNISQAQADNLIYSAGLQIYSTKDTSIQKMLTETYTTDSLFPDVVYKYDVTYTVSIENTETGKQTHKDYRQFVKTKEAGDTFVANKKAEIEQGLASNEKILADRVSYSVQPQSSMVIMDYKNGNVVAIAGGRGDKVVNRGFNRATDAVRQPGSVFKILAAYAPAIDLSVLMPGSVLVDEEIKIGNYSPKNWYGQGYRGPSTVREGVEQSMNILAVKAMDAVGVNTAYRYLQNFGFTTLQNDNHLSTALGGITYGVTQLEVTAAYAAIANNGKYYEPTFYSKVLDHDGNVLLDNTNREYTQVIKETTAYMLTDMMEGVVTKGTGTAARFKNSPIPVAGKTGTTQETKDLTFVGYTPYYVAGIWFGYDRYDTVVPNMMARVEGKRVIANDRYHLNIWRDAMEKIHKDLPKVDFPPMPSNIVEATICLDSGLLATANCKADPRGDRVVTDIFLAGTEPKDACDVHNAVIICVDSGKLATDFCPPESRQTKILSSFKDENGNFTVPTEPCDIHLEPFTEESTDEDLTTIYPSDITPPGETTEDNSEETSEGDSQDNTDEDTTDETSTDEVIVEPTVGETSTTEEETTLDTEPEFSLP